MGIAAQRSSADADTAQDLGLITDTDLPKLNTGLEHRCQIFHQFTEINSSVSGKVKQHFVIIKGVLCIDELHLQPMLLDLFLADLKCFFFFFLIGCCLLVILLCCHTDHRLQWLHYTVILYITVANHHITIFHTAGGLHDHMVSTVDLQLSRRKVVDLSSLTKTNTYYLYHISSPSLSGEAVPWPYQSLHLH